MFIYSPFTGIAPAPSSSTVNDVSGSAQNSLPFIIGIAAGLVGLLIIMIIIVLSVVLVRKRKPAAVTKQPFYDYVTPPQPPTQHERIQLKENEAYGKVLSDTSRHQESTPLQPNIAYGFIQTHQNLRDKEDIEPQEYELPLSSKCDI